MMIFGYARVSTPSQDLKAQIQQLMDTGVLKENIYVEKYTGTTMNRPQLDELTWLLRRGDELVVTKLDRIGRTMTGIIETIDALTEKGVTVNILTTGKVDNSAIGKLVRNILASFASFEQDMIVQRMQEGKDYTKKHKKNYHEGRPKRRKTKQTDAIYQASQNHTIKDTAKMFGVSPSTVTRIKRLYSGNQAS